MCKIYMKTKTLKNFITHCSCVQSANGESVVWDVAGPKVRVSVVSYEVSSWTN